MKACTWPRVRPRLVRAGRREGEPARNWGATPPTRGRGESDARHRGPSTTSGGRRPLTAWRTLRTRRVLAGRHTWTQPQRDAGRATASTEGRGVRGARQNTRRDRSRRPRAPEGLYPRSRVRSIRSRHVFRASRSRRRSRERAPRRSRASSWCGTRGTRATKATRDAAGANVRVASCRSASRVVTRCAPSAADARVTETQTPRTPGRRRALGKVERRGLGRAAWGLLRERRTSLGRLVPLRSHLSAGAFSSVPFSTATSLLFSFALIFSMRVWGSSFGSKRRPFDADVGLSLSRHHSSNGEMARARPKAAPIGGTRRLRRHIFIMHERAALVFYSFSDKIKTICIHISPVDGSQLEIFRSKRGVRDYICPRKLHLRDYIRTRPIASRRRKQHRVAENLKKVYRFDCEPIPVYFYYTHQMWL